MKIMPPATRRDEIRFKFAKSWPYNLRLAVMTGLYLFGLAIEYAGASTQATWWWLGLPCLLAGTLLGLVHGYDNLPSDTRSRGTEWRTASVADLTEIRRISRQSRAWDASLIDITCWQGALCLALLSAGVAVLAMSLAAHPPWHWVLVADALVMLLPHWITGVRFILTNHELEIKNKLLLKLTNFFDQLKQEQESLQIMMELRQYKDGRQLPTDLKAIVKSTQAPEKFLGLQVQVSINDVQGNSFPYFYCILVAQKGLPLHAGIRKLINDYPEPGNIIVEYKSEADVEVVVIRQKTTRHSGYYTRWSTCCQIFSYALLLMRNFVQQTTPAEGEPANQARG